MQSKQKHQQQQQKQSSQNSTASESQNPFSPSSNEAINQDQDMRIPLNSTSSNDKIVELSNQDVDMRILAMPHRGSSGSDRSKHKKNDTNNFSKNTQSDKSNEQTTSRKMIDYSQYLRDANIDLNQSDSEDTIGRFIANLVYSLSNQISILDQSLNFQNR